jgi:hypothetical protein
LQTFTNANTLYAVTFNVEDLDTDDGHNPSVNPSRWTCPSGRQGKYLVEGGYAGAPAGAYSEAYMYKNGSQIAASGARVYNGGATINSETPLCLVSLNAGDYVELYARITIAGSFTDILQWAPHMAVLRLCD